jgi:hypothetical protein
MFFQVLTPSSGFLDYAISMRPDYHQAIIDVVRYYGWRKIIYLYDSHDGKYTFVQIDCFRYNSVMRAHCRGNGALGGVQEKAIYC